MSIFAELRRGVVAAHEKDTRAVAARVAAELPVDRTIALVGDLGAGKTTFVKGLAEAWNVRETVTSPSFALCNIHRGSRLLVHCDAYRLPDPDAWTGLMIEDFLVSPWCLVIEWPEKVRAHIPQGALWLELTTPATGGRTIRMLSDGAD